VKDDQLARRRGQGRGGLAEEKNRNDKKQFEKPDTCVTVHEQPPGF
jgi:hypothetical protein